MMQRPALRDSLARAEARLAEAVKVLSGPAKP
jgi:hypothetical protein